ncbi:MAG TPA: HD domain-containing phosphohydrolase [Solirubrobacteraceae bacterium]|nr:HD domain-containing phosphohydrolase [Solirubrobacteraceae bacterium]
MERWLPHVLIATAFVVILPALAVWTVIPPGHAALLAISVPLGMALSVAAATVGAAIWKRMPGSRDVVFADLMLWGWLRRSVAERRLAQAEKLLGNEVHGLSLQALTNLSTLLEARDSRTYGHSQRVTRHAERIAATMGLPAAEVARVRTAAALHDIGKLHTPRAILNKPGRLTDTEFSLVKRHPDDGAEMSVGVGDPVITAMIRHHHERLDGRGYPDGLAGEEIPLGARIIAVADTFDAITSNRTYRRASRHKRALDVLAREAGKQLDPDAVAAFSGYYRGRRSVAWSAFAIAAPQRLLSWLGSSSPTIGASAAGAAALAIGVGSPQAPIFSPSPVAPLQAASLADPAPTREAAATLARFGAPGAAKQLASRRSPGTTRRPSRTRGVKPERSRPRTSPGTPGRPVPSGTAPSQAGSHPTSQAKPPQVKSPKVEVPKVKLPKVEVPKVKLPKVTLPKVKLPKVTLPKVEVPKVEVPKVELPKVEVPKVELPQLGLP